MQLKIHRGAHEIGGSCIELESKGRSILLDLGLPLTALGPDPSLLPPVAGLSDGSNANLLGIVLSHLHGDHSGLTGLVHPNIPVFMGKNAQILSSASRPFLKQAPQIPTVKTYTDKTPFRLGPFQIIPYLTDHSGFDAYSLLVEADGRRVFYSGDLRAHGRKAGLVEALLARPPEAIDCLLLEGTTLGRADSSVVPETETLLEDRILDRIRQTKGLALISFSPQNIDRFVTVFRASKRAGRTFIADVYLAYLLDQLGLASLPSARTGDFRIYLPDTQKRRIVRDKNFHLTSCYRTSRIFREEIAADPANWVMLFRDSMTAELSRMGALRDAALIYSLWPGYLNRPESRLQSWCADNAIAFDICHTSGHADPATLVHFATALKPQKVIPIHTEAAPIMQRRIPRTTILSDGIWMPV